MVVQHLNKLVPDLISEITIQLPDEVTQQGKNEAAIKLLQEWANDESGYDEKTWPVVKKAIEENRLSIRKKFND
ncbi:MAG: hypothetical protein ABRQ38_28650 [Candidatus Eremiobacterota bacterium]